MHLTLLAAFVVALMRSWGVWDRSGLDFGAFWTRFRGFLGACDTNFRSFFVQGCCHCHDALDTTKTQFHWVETHFASNMRHTTNDKISLHASFGRSCSQESCPKHCFGVGLATVIYLARLTLHCCLLLCLALLLGFLGFSAAPPASEFYVWACEHFCPLGLHVQRYLCLLYTSPSPRD